jgi:hypothetical protein
MVAMRNFAMKTILGFSGVLGKLDGEPVHHKQPGSDVYWRMGTNGSATLKRFEESKVADFSKSERENTRLLFVTRACAE